jgi:hypothetical protein
MPQFTMLNLILTTSLVSFLGLAQTTLDAASCIIPGQLSTFSTCDAYFSTGSYCQSLSQSNSQAFVPCYCDQGFLNAIYEYTS